MYLLALWPHTILWLRAAAQSTSMPVPPMQWLNLNGLTKGSAPPPLKDSVIGYDENTRSLIVFGGESQAGVPQQATYLLNLDSLIWSTPVTKVATQTSTPPSRSRALGSGDFAANSRRDFVIFGGRGSDNNALADVWAFDYLNQFWYPVTTSSSQPQPRWGAIGGIDPSVVPSSGNDISTTLFVAGGSDDTHSFPPSDLWQLNITGTLASDITTIRGQWKNSPILPALAGKSDAGGTLIPQNQGPGARIVVSGGCGSDASPLNVNASCIDPKTYVMTVGGSPISPNPCSAPRIGPVIVPNLNQASSSFASQAFILLGTSNTSQWNNDQGLDKGEVAVLDTAAGTWARILPAGDPGPNGVNVPTPRQGAAAFAFHSALVGTSRQSSSDTIIFGGQDAQGNYLDELWILRAYNASITNSGQHWSGFGNGNLQTGISALGTGVTIQYISQCARQLPTSTSTSSSAPTKTASPTVATPFPFNVSIAHRVLSPLSVAVALTATLLARFSSPAANYNAGASDQRPALKNIAIFAGVVSYAIGIGGFSSSLASTTRSSSNVHRRSPGTSADAFLKTPHGRAGFALFLGLYGLVPAFALCLQFVRWKSANSDETATEETPQLDPDETGALNGEKRTSSVDRPGSPSLSAPEVHSTPSTARRQRANSGPGLFPGWRRSKGNKEVSEPGPSRSFEVVNRPRRASGGMVLYPPRDLSQRPRSEIPISLNDISWLERRRSVGVVGELDYALNQIAHASPRSSSPPPTSRPPTVTMSSRPFVRTPTPLPPLPVQISGWDVTLHILFHTFLLANCLLVLVALFSRAPIASFIIFLVWTLVFYICLLVMAYNGRPRSSILSTAILRLRTPIHVVPATPLGTDSPIDERSTSLHSPLPGAGPYLYHQPQWRRTMSHEEEVATSTSHGGRLVVETDTPDDDDDDHQRRMEEELNRRDVNIVTVPRRKLWITNPS